MSNRKIVEMKARIERVKNETGFQRVDKSRFKKKECVQRGGKQECKNKKRV